MTKYSGQKRNKKENDYISTTSYTPFMTTFYLMRHGEPDWGLATERGLIGHGADMVPLTPTGLEEVQTKIAELSGYGVEHILSSPMTRALQTGHIVSQALQLPLSVEFDLHEWVPDVRCNWTNAEQVHTQFKDYTLCKGEPPEGTQKHWEARSHLQQRARQVLERHSHYEAVLVTCHCVLIESLTSEILEHAGIIPFELP